MINLIVSACVSQLKMDDQMLRCIISEESNVVRILHGGKLDAKEPKGGRKRRLPNNGPVIGRWTKKEHKLFVEGRQRTIE